VDFFALRAGAAGGAGMSFFAVLSSH